MKTCNTMENGKKACKKLFLPVSAVHSSILLVFIYHITKCQDKYYLNCVLLFFFCFFLWFFQKRFSDCEMLNVRIQLLIKMLFTKVFVCMVLQAKAKIQTTRCKIKTPCQNFFFKNFFFIFFFKLALWLNLTI